MSNAETLAYLASAEFVIILALIWALFAGWRMHVRSIDRLLLLGKSTTPGEAIAAYERLNRIERIRGATEELMAQRRRGEAADVARKDPSARWWGLRKRRPTTPPASGG